MLLAYRWFRDRLLAVLEMLATALLILSVLVVLAGVISRNAFNVQPAWLGSMSQYAVVWSTFLAAGVVLRENLHVRMIHLQPRGLVSQIVMTIADLIMVVFSLVVGWASIRLIASQLQYDQRASEFFNIPSAYIYSVIPLSMFCMVLVSIEVVVRHLSKAPTR